MMTTLLITLLAVGPQGFTAQQECSGHGKRGEQGCVCDNAWPTEGGSGWVGPECEVPAFAGAADGADMTHLCADRRCSEIDANGWACWAVPLATAPNATFNYLSIMLNRTNDGTGDPDLYAFWKDDPSPNFLTPSGFAFQDTSAGRKPLVRKTVAKKDFGGAEFKHEGVYLCVHDYGREAVAVSLVAMVSHCPSTFDPSGIALQCSSPIAGPEAERRFSECTAAGECVCNPPYAKPVAEPFKGLGFDECSAISQSINSTQLSASRPFVANHEHVEADSWVFYEFIVDPEDFQIVVTVAERSRGRVDLFAKAGAPPGFQFGEFDVRPSWNAATDNRQLQLQLDASHEKFRTGPWFVGVVASELAANYTMTVAKYSCPNNCSSNGACDLASHTCACQEGFGGADCSLLSTPLQYGSVASHNSSSAFEYEFYALPEVTDTMLGGNVEVIIEAVFSSTAYSHHLQAHPAVLVAATGDGSFPSSINFTHRIVLDQQAVPRSLALCASQLRKGDWKLAVYNPLPTAPLNYTLSLKKVGRCLNECSDHGTCEEGICQCKNGWAGGDCSVVARSHAHTFFWMLFSLVLGAAAAFGFIHLRGVPSWLPIRTATFGGIGLYQELTEHEGI